MIYTCPNCKTQNEHQLTFPIKQYVCRECQSLVNAEKQQVKKLMNKSASNIVLDLKSKGIIDGVEYFVVGIVVRRYNAAIYWREYYLKDKYNNDAFLSETDGHWVFLKPTQTEFKEESRYCNHDGKLYRLYETTPSTIHTAQGFFEEPLDFKLTQYKEYVNGTEMVSWEETGNSKYYLHGKHVSKYAIKKAFQPSYMPNYSGIGIVEPYYFDRKASVTFLAIIALIMTIFQFWFTSPRENHVVFDETIPFQEVLHKEKTSGSFNLEGMSAPLKVKLHSNVDNSWANVELSLVNEATNEVIYASKDVEIYSGVEGGEAWTEGSQTETFNICGVAPGRYHLQILGQKQYQEVVRDVKRYYLPNSDVHYEMKEGDAYVDRINIKTGDHVSLHLENLEKNDPFFYKEFIASKEFTTANPNFVSSTPVDPEDPNPDFKLTVEWMPVSYWNYGIALAILCALGLGIYIGHYYFQQAKWQNSNNSPY